MIENSSSHETNADLMGEEFEELGPMEKKGKIHLKNERRPEQNFRDASDLREPTRYKSCANLNNPDLYQNQTHQFRVCARS